MYFVLYTNFLYLEPFLRMSVDLLLASYNMEVIWTNMNQNQNVKQLLVEVFSNKSHQNLVGRKV